MAFSARATGNRLLDQLFKSIEQDFKALALAILGDRVRTFELTTSDKPCSHGLNRKARGYIVVGLSADEIVYDGTASDDPAKTYNLKASGPVTARVIFF